MERPRPQPVDNSYRAATWISSCLPELKDKAVAPPGGNWKAELAKVVRVLMQTSHAVQSGRGLPLATGYKLGLKVPEYCDMQKSDELQFFKEALVSPS